MSHVTACPWTRVRSLNDAHNDRDLIPTMSSMDITPEQTVPDASPSESEAESSTMDVEPQPEEDNFDDIPEEIRRLPPDEIMARVRLMDNDKSVRVFVMGCNFLVY